MTCVRFYIINLSSPFINSCFSSSVLQDCRSIPSLLLSTPKLLGAAKRVENNVLVDTFTIWWRLTSSFVSLFIYIKVNCLISLSVVFTWIIKKISLHISWQRYWKLLRSFSLSNCWWLSFLLHDRCLYLSILFLIWIVEKVRSADKFGFDSFVKCTYFLS